MEWLCCANRLSCAHGVALQATRVILTRGCPQGRISYNNTEEINMNNKEDLENEGEENSLSQYCYTSAPLRSY